MNKYYNRLIFVTLLSVFLLFSCREKEQSGNDFTKYVNCFIGTSENGHTFPGACCPMSLIQTSPVTGAIGWRYCSEYIYADTTIWGFSQTHLNGTGCLDLGNLLIMPFTKEKKRDWDGYRSGFNKGTEYAKPGYYSVYLNDHNIKVELTATDRVAFHKYTYKEGERQKIFIDLQHSPAWNEKQYHSQTRHCDVRMRDEYTLVGVVENSVWVYQKYFFVVVFDKPIKEYLKLDKLEREVGDRLVLEFDNEKIKSNELKVKIALSTTSVDGAIGNLNKELPHWDFNLVCEQANDKWNDVLSRMEVKGSDDEKVNFYTSMYHLFIQPNCISDVDGKYRNCNDSVVSSVCGEFYSTFSLWDTYRAAHPLYTIIATDKVIPFVNSLIEQADYQGFLPIWTLWGRDNLCMIGNHSVSVISEAYNKGYTDFDSEKAFKLIDKGLNETEHGKNKWSIYNKYGYYPTDLIESESVSMTLENCYDDYSAAQFARKLNKNDKYHYYINRANNYKNLFDKSTNFMRPKLSNGSWKSDFNPNNLSHAESVGGDYTEGNAWQYTWHVQHDIEGLIDLFGGRDRFINKLDSLFNIELDGEHLADVTGLIGQYAHGNEPSHHIAYMYALAGDEKSTQSLVRNIFKTKYLNRSDGLCGNDDCGQMSAWYIFAAMGFYPVSPVDAEYVIGAPQLQEIKIKLPNKKAFKIVAENLSEHNIYVKEVYLNGKLHKEKTIKHSDIMNGGELRFVMTN